jgi:hypothetical protein
VENGRWSFCSGVDGQFKLALGGQFDWRFQVIEPDCKSCHTNFNIREDGYSGTSFNKWVSGFADLYRNRTDEQGVMCIACHGSTHAVYGAENKFGKQRDNMQPLQYQGLAGTIGTHENCSLCHTKKMNANGHHRNQIKRKISAAIVP